MKFDLRLAIGSLFSLFGLLLSIYGLVTPASHNQVSLGLNVNLGWGLVLLVFGLVMLTLALRARRRA